MLWLRFIWSPFRNHGAGTWVIMTWAILVIITAILIAVN